jgi:hypothetical protein
MAYKEYKKTKIPPGAEATTAAAKGSEETPEKIREGRKGKRC